jgi:hypothetical protein
LGTILFYNGETRGAAIGTLTTNQFTTTKRISPGAFSRWTHVVARGSLVLFYDRDTGSAAFGALTPDNLITRFEPQHGSFSRWTNIVNTADGWLFYDRMTGMAAVGSLQSAGSAHWFTTTASLPAGSLSEWTHIVANGQTVFFYNRLNGSGAIATVTAIGMTTTVSFDPGSFGLWTHIVNHGPTLLFYNRDTGAAAIGTLTASGFTTNVTYNPGAFGAWTHVISDGATLFFYNRDDGTAAIGTLSPGSFTTTTTFKAGQFGRWTHVTGDSASGPEELDWHVDVLLCHWHRPPGLTTVLSADFYRRYMFDLSNDRGIGRYFFDQSGGRLRFVGRVNDWVPLSKPPSDPSIAGNRQSLGALAVADAQKTGWHPKNAQGVVIFVACDQASGVDAGALGQQITIDGVNRWVAVLHADSANYVAFTGGRVDNFRFDFNCHEVGHLVGRQYSFGHAYGPNGPYDSPYCIMAAKTYGYLRNVTYDPWTPGSTRPPEEHTKGPGLAGSTRAGCGWARTRRIQAAGLAQPIEVYLAHVDDHESCRLQVIEIASSVNGVPTVHTVEFRCQLAERDQALPTAIVLCQREGSRWSSDKSWAPFSSTFIADGVIAFARPLPSVSQPGVVRADVLEVAPAKTVAGRTAPPWIRVRLSSA